MSEFQRWYWTNYAAIEQEGNDEDVDLKLLVLKRLAEYTSDYIDAEELLNALHTDPLVRQELSTHRLAVAK